MDFNIHVVSLLLNCIALVRRNQSPRPTQDQAQSQRLDDDYYEPHAPHPKHARNLNFMSEIHPDYLKHQDIVKGDVMEEASET